MRRLTRNNYFWSKYAFAIKYLRTPAWDTGIVPPELLDFIANHPPGRALDMGCGTATTSIALAQHGWQVTAVDFVPRAIRQAKRKAKAASVTLDLRVGDVTKLHDLSGPFDLILDKGCRHSLALNKRAPYTQNVSRLLAPRGSYLLHAFINPPPIVPPGISEAEVEELSALFSLISRKDGFFHKTRPSVWIHFTKP